MQLRNVGVLINTVGPMVDVDTPVINVIPKPKATRMKQLLNIKWEALKHTVAEGVSRVVT